MQFPLMFDAPRSSVQELDLAPELLLQELTAFLPKPGKPARELPAAPLPDTFSEMSLHGSQEQCLQLLAPILRQLSDKDDARWLTLEKQGYEEIVSIRTLIQIRTIQPHPEVERTNGSDR